MCYLSANTFVGLVLCDEIPSLISLFLASCKVTDANYSYLVMRDPLSIVDQIAFAKS